LTDKERIKNTKVLQSRYDNDPDHSTHVRKLAKEIYAGLKKLNVCKKEDSVYLQAGALLHDIGQYVQLKDHHLYSRDIILRDGIKGFKKKELKAVASIARYHRRNPPSSADPEYKAMSKKWRRTVAIGAAIVRIADGLDRSHKCHVKKVTIKIKKKELVFKLESDVPVNTEIWGALRKKALIENITGLNCRFISDQDNMFHG